jgi:hypothetical protein
MLEKHNQYFKPRGDELHPTRRADKIEPGGIYRSRSGERIRVYATEGKELHGAILHKGAWEIDTWGLDGKYLAGKGKDHVRDIVISPPLKLTPGLRYKTRDGRPAKVFETNQTSVEFPVIGAIKDEQGNWLPRVWNTAGVAKIPYGAGNDLVTDWSDT